MTVSYNLDVSSVSAFTFFKLLFRWRGSIYKSMITELIAWLCGYYAVFIVYRNVLSKEAQLQFERIAEYCDEKLQYIPLTFMLGFFVTIVVDRWRSIFQNMGWVENLALTVATFVRGDTKTVTLYRRSIVRYCILSQIMVFRDVSLRVRRRFPTMESLIVAGFLHENELRDLENIKIIYNKYWAPLNWATTLCMKAYKEGYIETFLAAYSIQSEIKNFRTNLALLCNFDWVPIPIAYPQVVFLAVRMYFLICMVSRQYIVNETAINKNVIDLYVPFMTILQFIFLVGWMKVAEALLNPLGEDDDDFECNFLIDKNIATGLCIVDDTYDVCPHLYPDRLADPYYYPVFPEENHRNRRDSALLGSAEGIEFETEADQLKLTGVDVEASKNRNNMKHLSDSSLARRMSAAFVGKINGILKKPYRSQSVQPTHIGSVFQLPFDYAPPHVRVKSCNGDEENTRSEEEMSDNQRIDISMSNITNSPDNKYKTSKTSPKS